VGLKIAGKRPMTLITDGMPAYRDALKKSSGLQEIQEPNTLTLLDLGETGTTTRWKGSMEKSETERRLRED